MSELLAFEPSAEERAAMNGTGGLMKGPAPIPEEVMVGNPATDMFPAALAVPLRLHVVEFKSAGFLKVRGFCKGCGWTLAGQGSHSDVVYWRARAHLEEVRQHQAIPEEGE